MARAPLSKVSLAVALLLLAAVMGFGWLASSGRILAASGVASSGKLQAFGSDAELSGFLKRLQARRAQDGEAVASNDAVAFDAAEAPMSMAPAPADAAQARVALPGITNNQEVGVD